MMGKPVLGREFYYSCFHKLTILIYLELSSGAIAKYAIYLKYKGGKIYDS